MIEDAFDKAKSEEDKALSQNEKYEKKLRLKREELDKTVNTLYDKSKELHDLREKKKQIWSGKLIIFYLPKRTSTQISINSLWKLQNKKNYYIMLTSKFS